MADADSVGKIGLDLEIQDGDIGKQIEKMASSIGSQISKSLEGITGKFDFSSITKGISESLSRGMNTIDETIKSSVEKSKANILKTIEEIKSKALEAIRSIIAKSKEIKIPMQFSPVSNIAMPSSKVATQPISRRGPPKSNVNVGDLESIKAKIENLSNSLEITNRSIEQQQEKLSGLKAAYNSTFNQARKNKLQEQILKTEDVINKLIAKSDATGFKLADLDRQFERLSNSAKNSTLGLNEASNSMKRLENTTSRTNRNLRNANNSTRRYRENMNGARSATGMFIDSMFRWGIVFPLVMKGITTVAGYIGSALMTNAQFANSLAQIRTNLMVAFMPIYQAVLPALNALMSALATVTAYIAAFISAIFGKTYQASFGAAKSMNASIASMKNMEKQGKKTSGAVDKIGDSAEKTKKKIQRSLAGFDEINKLSIPDDSDKAPKAPKGGGGGGGIDPIPMVAPDIDLSPTSVAMQKINAMVEKLKDIISKIFQPFKNAWAREGAATIASIKYALHGIWELIKAIGSSFLEVWTNGTGEAILVVILQILQNIFNIIGDIAITFADAWNAGGIGTSIVQSLANTFLNLLTVVKLVGDSFREVWGEVGPGLATTFMQILNATAGRLEFLSQMLIYVWDNGGSHLFQGFIRLGAKIFELAGYIYTQFVIPFANWFDGIIAPVIAKIADILGTVLDAFSNLINWLMGSGKPVLDTIIIVLGSLGASILIVKGALALWTIAQTIWTTVATISTTATTLLGGAIAFLTSPIGIAIVAITAIIAIGVALYKNWDFVKAKATEIWGKIKEIFNSFKEWLSGVFQTDWSNSFGVLGEILNGLLKNVDNVWQSVKRIFGGIIDFVTGVFTGNWSQAWQGIVDIFGGIMDGLGAVIKAPLNGVISLVNAAIAQLNKISVDIPEGVPIFGGKHFGVNIPKISYLAKGGIVDKPTQAVVGEAGTEAVVPLENNTGGLNLLANKLFERINNMLLTSSSLLQQPDLTMLGQNIDSTNTKSVNTNDYEKFKEIIIEAILEAMKNKRDNSYSNNSNSQESGDLILRIRDTDLGRIAIEAINKVNRQAGEQLLNL
ncbi:hypothetical protein JJB75_16350 [Clostridium perfringens]|uniref:hypothetical protein n=1 Tax=Clostridium perfringens TaxID=1502 RepID=UPI000D70D9DB|nr:hypothetical protein [Clostridium perfringens]EGT4140442.1 hypothetical protein [Clostridium perfringens]MBO3304649.1 hypothetical protein [Clostridium perfringens]MBO3307972.1 hypothetical protein [Clostridium perfringens]MBO3311317.1 hypothetical protein [Clostridium perfringens]MBO3317646.1 hypothetical protein [Clostridium perfringens]